MGAGYVFRLRKGGRVLDLSAAPYALTESFIPPSVLEEPVMGRGRKMGVNALSQSFSCSVDISGSSIGELDNAFDDLKAMLELAGDEGDPLYADWIPQTNVSFESAYGQWNAVRSCEVGWGATHKPEVYTSNRGSLFLTECPIDLLIDPYPLGVEQTVGKASGCVWEDWYGSPTRRSRGLGICGAGANKFTNPVFGHSTYDNGWTAEANLYRSKCTVKDLALFEKVSVELVNNTAGTLDFTQSLTLTVATYIISFFAKKRDKSAVTSSDIVALYDTTERTMSFYSLGNGWYWAVSNSFTGIASAKVAGCSVKSGKSIIVDGFKCEQSSYVTPFGYGNMPGWVWDGTAHASASTRTAGQLSLPWPTTIYPGKGTITIVWTPTFNSSDVASGSFYLFCVPGAVFELWWDAAVSRFKFEEEGFNVTQSAVTSFTANVPVVIHLVYGINRTAQIYINGAASGSAGTYYFVTPLAGDTIFYIGTDSTKTNPCYGVFSAFTTSWQPMTSTEVANDYAYMLPLINARKRVDYIPWRWCKDNTYWYVNAVYDSSRTNWTIIGGVPGTVEAITRMRIFSISNLSTSSKGGFFLSRTLVPLDVQMANHADFYGELSGTVDPVPANSSGGYYETKAGVTTTIVSFTTAITIKNIMLDILSGQEVALLYRVKDALGTGLMARFYYQFGLDATFYSAWANVESKSSFLMRVTPFLGFKDIRRNIEGLTLTYPAGSGFVLQVKRSAGTGDVLCDFYQIVTKPTLRIWSTTAQTTTRRVLYDSKTHDVISLKSTDEMATDLVYAEGDVFELMPEYLNFLISCPGDIKRELGEVVADDYLIFESVTVTPRWALQ